MKIEIEGFVHEASAVTVTLIGDDVGHTIDDAMTLIRNAHGRKAIVFRQQSDVRQRQDGRFEVDVELHDYDPANND